MNLVIDFGNTNIKCGVFDTNMLIESKSFQTIDELKVFIKNGSFQKLAVCSVSHSYESLKQEVPDLKNALFLTHHNPTPLSMSYETPETLGMDRLAAAVGASTIFPDVPLMVIDIGTCITYDFINGESEYLGGMISPGVELRYKSMNDYTQNLPLINDLDTNQFIGRTTRESLASGVINGIVGEIESHISQLLLKNADLKVIMTGGGSKIFESKIKSDIFVALEIVLVGLNRVLEYNVE